MRISAPSNGTALPAGTRLDGNPAKTPMAYPYKEPRHANVPGAFVFYPATPPLSFVSFVLQKCKNAKGYCKALVIRWIHFTRLAKPLHFLCKLGKMGCFEGAK
jgi:hypothetical protein